MNHLTESAMFNFVDRNPHLVTAKVQSNGFRVLKYKNKVFYDNLWTPELIECRGTVVDVIDDCRLKVIQRPFTKIFNYNERGTRIHRNTPVRAVRKINGFMGALTWHNGAPLVSTTGSCDSEFAKMAYDMLEQTDAFGLAEFLPPMTLIFEIVHPSDPHIYPEHVGVYLLGARVKQWDTTQHAMSEGTLDQLAAEYKLKRPETYHMQFGDLVKLNKTVDHEGFVCWTDEGYELKLKSPHYLVTKFLARINSGKFMAQVDADPEQLKRRVDEEFYPVIDYAVANKNEFIGYGEQTRIKMIRNFIEGMNA